MSLINNDIWLTHRQSPDGKLVASGHENGGVYIFNIDTGRIFHSLPCKIQVLHGWQPHWYRYRIALLKPVRCVAFSPAGKLLAASGDSKVIAIFDVVSGEQVANLVGHSSWIFSICWSSTGEYILSGCVHSAIPPGNSLTSLPEHSMAKQRCGQSIRSHASPPTARQTRLYIRWSGFRKAWESRRDLWQPVPIKGWVFIVRQLVGSKNQILGG